MASALFRVVRLGAHICLCQATASAFLKISKKVPCIIDLSIRTCRTVPVLRSSENLLPNGQNTDSSDVESAVKDCDSVDSLLSCSNNATTIPSQELVNIISSLGRLAGNQPDSILANRILNDKNFTNLCAAIDEHVSDLLNTELIRIIKALVAIGVSPTDRVFESIEVQILWKIRSMKLKSLINVFVFFISHQNTDLQKRLLNECKNRIQQRWFEMSQPWEAVLLLRHSSLFPSGYVHKIEDRVMELIEIGMSAEELHNVFVTLAEQRLRKTQLLRSITYHLTKHQEKLSAKQIANMTNAMSTLNYVDQPFLRRISDDLIADVPDIKSRTIITTVLTAFGKMQWRHPALTDAISEWYEKNIVNCRVSDLVAYVLASARFQRGFVSSEMNDGSDRSPAIVDAVFSRVSRETINADFIWLSFVWSLAIVGFAKPNHVRSIINDSFYEKLVEKVPEYRMSVTRKKILNIHAVAKWELGYNEPLPEDLMNVEFNSLFAKEESELNKSILDTLSNNVPRGKFMSCNKWTPSGFFVDAEFVLDKDTKPLPIEDYTTNFGQTSSLKPLPPGAHRVALLIQDFKDFTFNSVTLTGLASLSVRILKKSGYKVVQIPYSEYNLRAPTVKRLQYLQTVINDTIGLESKTFNK